MNPVGLYLAKRIRGLFNRRYRRTKGFNVFLNGLTLSKRTKISNEPIILSLLDDQAKKDMDPGPNLFSFYYKGPGKVRHQGDVFLVDHEIHLDIQVEFLPGASRRQRTRVDISDPKCFDKIVGIFSGLFVAPTESTSRSNQGISTQPWDH